jgi:hypothetical protein
MRRGGRPVGPGCWDDFGVQDRSEGQRELLDAESVAGHLLKAGSVFGFLAAHRRELFPDVHRTARPKPLIRHGRELGLIHQMHHPLRPRRQEGRKGLRERILRILPVTPHIRLRRVRLAWDLGKRAHQGDADSRRPGSPAFLREEMALRGWPRRYLSTMGLRGNAGRVHDQLRLSHEVGLRNRR